MTQGRSIRLFLVDGSPTGLMTAEIVNWTGHVITAPRSKLSELVQRPECNRTGVYFLVGSDPGVSLRPLVYIGETDDVATRLKNHNRPESKGGKDFWDRVCLVTSKDANLTKAHVKYLESALIRSALDANACHLSNGTAHGYSSLPESDRADMAYFLEQIRIVLPVLGFDFLRHRAPSSDSGDEGPSTTNSSPRFVLEIKKHGLHATAREVDGEFYVEAGSLARKDWMVEGQGYETLFEQLCESGVLALADDGTHRVFTSDQFFSSPSAAAAVVYGQNANGRTMWKMEYTGQTYGDWQDQRVSDLAPEPE